MHAIIVDGNDDFIKEAMQNLDHKGFTSIGYQAAYISPQQDLNKIVRSLKEIESYKKYKSKNKIYISKDFKEISPKRHRHASVKYPAKGGLLREATLRRHAG